jgi:hypothetical protein
MNYVILLHFGGSVTEQFELVGMRTHMNWPHILVDQFAKVRAVMNVGSELRLHRRYDMGEQHTNLCDVTFRVRR